MANQIVCGEITFLDADIISGECYIGNALAGDALSIDTLIFTVYSTCLVGGGIGVYDVTTIPYGTITTLYSDEDLIGKFYVNQVIRTGATSFEISCVSAVGILDQRTHYGGIYSGDTASDVLEDIIGDIPYSVSDEVGACAVFGWLPVASRRENLHQVLFSLGASIEKDTSGTINIIFLDASSSSEIPDDRM